MGDIGCRIDSALGDAGLRICVERFCVHVTMLPRRMRHDVRDLVPMRPPPLAIRASARCEQRVFGTFGYPRRAPSLTAGDGLCEKMQGDEFGSAGESASAANR